MHVSAQFPDVDDLSALPTGDMPGDKVHITDDHVAKVRRLFPAVFERVRAVVDAHPHGRAVVAVTGGSGVGKSETGTLLAHGFRTHGLGAYVLSGDNYPRRVPADNDAERRRVFRVAGAQGLAAAGAFTDAVRAELAALQATDADADASLVADRPWLADYQRAGRAALADYLGHSPEIDFDEVNAILARFASGAESLTLKRMGRSRDELWYDEVDVSDVDVLVIEWTHGNNAHVRGVDVAILLNSTPAETLAHRRARARDGALDSPFTTMVLGLEQAKLHAQAPRASFIQARSGQLISHDAYLQAMGAHLPNDAAMLNVYPDSLGDTLAGTVELVRDERVAGAFGSAYLLPSVFNSDLDRGFSVIDYSLNRALASADDVAGLVDAGLDLKFDFVLNHASVLSPQFQDLVARGSASAYADFFVDWNKFWAGCGEMTPQGYIQPRDEFLEHMFFRKPGLPILMVRFPDGTEHPYWNTFYQSVRYPHVEPEDLMGLEPAAEVGASLTAEVRAKRASKPLQYTEAARLADRINAELSAGVRPADLDLPPEAVEWLESRRRYLGQMDLNIASPLVWEFYADVLDTLAGYGAEIVRLDAFAYAPKEPGATNFLNDPGTWELLDRVKSLASARGLKLLPEIHARYEEKIHQTLADKGFLTYDFFLPGLLLDALDTADASVLKRWLREVVDRGIRTVTMLGCHDGIPVLDLKGLLPDARIDELIARLKDRGGFVKDLHGSKATYYQVNATYFSALGASEERLLLARAIQLFAPGKPQVWYLDLFAGENDHDAVVRAGEGGHKEINRTNLTADAVAAGLERPVVQRQLELLRFRNTFGAFGWDAACEIADAPDDRLVITWRRDGHEAILDADLVAGTFTITADGHHRPF